MSEEMHIPFPTSSNPHKSSEESFWYWTQHAERNEMGRTTYSCQTGYKIKQTKTFVQILPMDRHGYNTTTLS